MEYSTILRTEIVFGKNTKETEKRKEDMKYNNTPADPVATWSSKNERVRAYLIIGLIKEEKNLQKFSNHPGSFI